MPYAELARLTGLTVKQLQRIEQGKSMPHETNQSAIAGALGLALLGLLSDDKPSSEPAVGGVKTGDFTSLAKLEAKRKLHELSILLGKRRVPLIGFDRLHRCELSYAEIGDTFAVVGTVREGASIPPHAAAALKAEQGRGAGYFRVKRDVPGLLDDGRAVALPVTVYAPDGAHGKRLHECWQRESPVTVLVRIKVARKGRAPWLIFPRLEPSPTLWPWAFVVEEVIDRGA